MAGKRAKCPGCGQPLVIPASQTDTIPRDPILEDATRARTTDTQAPIDLSAQSDDLFGDLPLAPAAKSLAARPRQKPQPSANKDAKQRKRKRKRGKHHDDFLDVEGLPTHVVVAGLCFTQCGGWFGFWGWGLFGLGTLVFSSAIGTLYSLIGLLKSASAIGLFAAGIGLSGRRNWGVQLAGLAATVQLGLLALGLLLGVVRVFNMSIEAPTSQLVINIFWHAVSAAIIPGIIAFWAYDAPDIEAD